MALAYPLANFVSAVPRHADKFDVSFFATALAWHLAFANAFLPPAESSFAVHLLFPGIVVVVVLVVVVVVVVQPTTPVVPALFSGVGGQASAKSVRLSFVELTRVRL